MRFLNAILLAALCAAPAVAQTSQPARGGDSTDDAGAKQRAAALLQKLAFDPKLVGTIRMGLYMNNKNLGSFVITVEKAAAGSGAVYKVSAKAKMVFGPMNNNFTETVWLDAGMGLVKLSGTSKETDQRGGKTKTKQLEKTGQTWSFTATFDDGSGPQKNTMTAPVKGPNHWEIGGLMLLCKKLDLKTPGTYALEGLKFPELTSMGWAGGVDKADWKPVTMQVMKPKKMKIRGTERSIVQVKVTRAGESGGAQFMLLDAAGNFYGMKADQMPIQMLVGTADEITKDLAGNPAEKAIKAAVRTWFEVVCKKKKTSDLDPIVDWGVYAEGRKKADPGLAGKTAMDLAAEAKKELEAANVPGGEQLLGMLDMALKTKVKGDTATVSLGMQAGGGGPVWKLKKISGSWKLIDFPLKLN